MTYNNPMKTSDFALLLSEVKQRIQLAQTQAVLSVNSELVRLYWDIGRIIDARQKAEGWGAAVIPRLAQELKNELPELKGFSERNIKRMLAFFREYPDPESIVPQLAALSVQSSTAKLPALQPGQSLLWAIPWFHHIVLMEKVKDMAARCWYMEQTLANGWSRNILSMQIKAGIHARHGKARSNFALSSFCNVVNERLKHPTDNPTIGLILCQERSRLMAEYSFAGIDKPIGISTYELTRALPKCLRSALPTVEEIEAELTQVVKQKPERKSKERKQ